MKHRWISDTLSDELGSFLEHAGGILLRYAPKAPSESQSGSRSESTYSPSGNTGTAVWLAPDEPFVKVRG